ncbi:hypothetical protein [Phaffia rhodozyma]|uniref:Uncharacterized protein n=1 Tax=Phaffia rhodozyma TaxID=264483 RepID=A0A0F7SRT6_PHARH|nr:hypothetical protein [Phaffia rhodozyma]
MSKIVRVKGHSYSPRDPAQLIKHNIALLTRPVATRYQSSRRLLKAGVSGHLPLGARAHLYLLIEFHLPAVLDCDRLEPRGLLSDTLSDVSSIHSSDLTSDDEDRADLVRFGDDLAGSTWTDLGPNTATTDFLSHAFSSGASSAAGDEFEPDSTPGSSSESGRGDGSLTDDEDDHIDNDRTFSGLGESFADLEPSIPSASSLSTSVATTTISDLTDRQHSNLSLYSKFSNACDIEPPTSVPDMRSSVETTSFRRPVKEPVSSHFQLAYPDPTSVSSTFSSPGSSSTLSKSKHECFPSSFSQAPSFRETGTGGLGSSHSRSAAGKQATSSFAPASAMIVPTTVKERLTESHSKQEMDGQSSRLTNSSYSTDRWTVFDTPSMSRSLQSFPSLVQSTVNLPADVSHPIRILLVGSSGPSNQRQTIVQKLLRLVYIILPETAASDPIVLKEFDVLGRSESTRTISDLREPFKRERKTSSLGGRQPESIDRLTGPKGSLVIEVVDLTINEDDDWVSASEDVRAHLRSLRTSPSITTLVTNLVDPSQRHRSNLELSSILSSSDRTNMHTIVLPVEISASFNPGADLSRDNLIAKSKANTENRVWRYEDFVGLSGEKDALEVWKGLSLESLTTETVSLARGQTEQEAEEYMFRLSVDWKRLRACVRRYVIAVSSLATALLMLLACLDYALEAFEQTSLNPAINVTRSFIKEASIPLSVSPMTARVQRFSPNLVWTTSVQSAVATPVYRAASASASARGAVPSETRNLITSEAALREESGSLVTKLTTIKVPSEISVWSVKDRSVMAWKTRVGLPSSLPRRGDFCVNRSVPSFQHVPLNQSSSVKQQVWKLSEYVHPTVFALPTSLPDSFPLRRLTLDAEMFNPVIVSVQKAYCQTKNVVHALVARSNPSAQSAYNTLHNLRDTVLDLIWPPSPIVHELVEYAVNKVNQILVEVWMRADRSLRRGKMMTRDAFEEWKQRKEARRAKKPWARIKAILARRG